MSVNRKEYNRAYLRKWRQSAKGKKIRLADKVKRKYGLSIDQYNELHKTTKLCEICGQPQESKKLSIDHDHKTGKIRGLLCFRCNTALGKFDDDIDVLASAISYLVNAGAVSNKKNTA